MSRHPDLPPGSVTTAAWWLFRAPYRTRNAVLAALDGGAPLVPEPAAVAAAAGAVLLAAHGAWPLLGVYVAVCAVVVAAARHSSRETRP